MSKQDEALAAMGVDVNDLPDNLETTKLQAVCDALGIDTSDMTDNLKSSYYEQIANEYTGGGGGGVNVLNENGIIKQQHLPEGYPYEEVNTVTGDTLTWDGNTEGLEYVETVGYKISDAVVTLANCADGVRLAVNSGEVYDFGADNIIEGAPGFVVVANGFCFFASQPITNESMGLTLKPGVYTLLEPGHTLEITIPGYKGFLTEQTVVTPIASKYLPMEDIAEALGVGGGTTVILPETEAVYSADQERFFIMNGVDASKFTLGEKYTINYNGADYECLALDGSLMGIAGLVGFGNVGAMLGGDSTGEPFVLGIVPLEAQPENGVAGIVIALDGATSVTVSISGNAADDARDKNANVFVDIYGTIGGTYHYDPKTRPENIQKRSHTNTEIFILAKAEKNVIIRNFYSDLGESKYYHLESVGTTNLVFSNASIDGNGLIYSSIRVSPSAMTMFEKWMD